MSNRPYVPEPYKDNVPCPCKRYTDLSLSSSMASTAVLGGKAPHRKQCTVFHSLFSLLCVVLFNTIQLPERKLIFYVEIGIIFESSQLCNFCFRTVSGLQSSSITEALSSQDCEPCKFSIAGNCLDVVL